MRGALFQTAAVEVGALGIAAVLTTSLLGITHIVTRLIHLGKTLSPVRYRYNRFHWGWGYSSYGFRDFAV